jgi:4-amino-4-deoxy-L-arabinose transferase-like glycosyltransferase
MDVDHSHHRAWAAVLTPSTVPSGVTLPTADEGRRTTDENRRARHDVSLNKRGSWRSAVVVIVVAALVRLVFAALVPVFPDEAYYWEWSRQLAPGFFDHPPAIAFLIRLGGELLAPIGASATSLAVRIGPVIAGFITAFATIATARRLAGDASALRAAVVITALPLAAAGLLLATPDAPLLLFTAVAFYTITRALQEQPRSSASLGWWMATGATLGLAFWSKYTSILLPLGVAMAVLLRADLRARLREPGPYVACVVATIVFLPVLIWNSNHDWVSFTYQLRHGLGAPSESIVAAALKREGDYIGGQAGLASPILFVLLAIAVGRSLRPSASPIVFALAVVAALSFALFAFSALRRRVEPNWPAPAYIPAIVLLATTTWGEGSKRWLRWGIGLGAAMSLVIYVQGVVPILPLAPRKDPVARAFGWRELAGDVQAAMHRATAETGVATWAGGDRYQEAAELAFHDETHAPTFALNLGGRRNQYDIWPRFRDRAAPGDNLVLVLDESPTTHPAVAALTPYFTDVAQGPLVSLRRAGGEIGKRRLWILRSWQGGWPAGR